MTTLAGKKDRRSRPRRQLSSKSQLPLALRSKFRHGGSRPGAGRKRSSSFQSHVPRPRFSAREPLHLTLRLDAGLPDIRRKRVFRCLERAVAKARMQGLAIAEFSVLSNHLHLLVEAPGHRALARQMQSLCIAFAKRLNMILRRRGKVFRERYHVHVLRTPSEVKNALRYVLTNEYKHLEKTRRRGSRGAAKSGKHGFSGRVQLDRYSSALRVDDGIWSALLGQGWRRVVGVPTASPDEEAEWTAGVRSWLSEPRSWLLKVGWRKALSTPKTRVGRPI